MNELVERLTKEQSVEASPHEKTAKSLKECIDRNYVHILFTKTGTEVGIELDKPNCKYVGCDFEKGEGTAHFEGGLILNYDMVRCIADINLSDLKGKGRLAPVDDKEYDQIMGRG
ncbi:MAG: MbtH domain protein [Candidatus Aminicenantes bacterium]|nr:MbtH domain protein [Candidatus Aminicenantes bacterium]